MLCEVCGLVFDVLLFSYSGGMMWVCGVYIVIDVMM